jgi:hypothetical protein
MMLLLMSIILMLFGVRFFIRSLRSVTELSAQLLTTYKISGVFLFCLGLVLLIFYCVIEILM